MTLAAASCQPAPVPDLGIAGARPVAYDAIRDASGVLGYAEPLLGPAIAPGRTAPVGPGAAAAKREAVVGAWELAAGTGPETVAATLRARGSLERERDYSDGQLWIADHKPRGGDAVRVLLIDGASPAWEAGAAPEVRPGPHVYLIAYRKP